MLGFYNYTVILTYIGMLTGYAGVIFAIEGDILKSLCCLLLAGFCDMFDGKIASTRKRTRNEKLFGVQIDSMSDLICFGILPSVIVYMCSGGGWLRVIPSALYALCALIRLSWFNVDEEDRQDREECSRQYFTGLPVTTSALIFPAVIGLCMKLAWPVHIIAPVVLAMTAIAFLTPFKMRKPARVGKVFMTLFGIVGLLIVLWAGEVI